MSDRWQSSRFSSGDEEPLGPLANLLDLMLVFACGLIAALIAMSEQLQQRFQAPELSEATPATQTSPAAKTMPTRVLERGRELPQLPARGEQGTEGYEAVGQVYRDPKSGQLILIGD